MKSFIGRFRDECLNQYWFGSLAETARVIETWRQHYNRERPHSAFDYEPPERFARRRPLVLRAPRLTFVVDLTSGEGHRKRHLETLNGLFVQVPGLCRHAGLVKLGHVTLEGTKLQANASKHQAMRDSRMARAEAELAAEVARWLAQAEAAAELRDEREAAPDTPPYTTADTYLLVSAHLVRCERLGSGNGPSCSTDARPSEHRLWARPTACTHSSSRWRSRFPREIRDLADAV